MYFKLMILPECFSPIFKRFTWRKPIPMQQTRLDFFLLTNTIFPYVEDISVESSFRSDHSIVVMKIKFDN